MHAVTGARRVLAGRYELMDPIGHGAMGTVWRARDPVLARDVAVKEIALPDLITEQDRSVLRERTLREARAAAKLNHQGVVTIYDVIEIDGNPWIVMELVSAQSLDQVLAQDGPLSPRRAAEMGVMVAGALAGAHSEGIVHRDVKPANVLLTPAGRDVLTDFGIASLAGEPGLTQVGMVMGTPGFCAPERIRGEPASPASDLWSLGATLYAAVEGRGPFQAHGSAMAVLAAIVHSEPPVPESAGPLGPVITSLLDRDPSRRPDAASAARILATVVSAGFPDTGTVASPVTSVTLPAPARVGRTTRTAADAPSAHAAHGGPDRGRASDGDQALARPAASGTSASGTSASGTSASRAPAAGDTAALPASALPSQPSSHPEAPARSTGRRGRAGGHARTFAQAGHRQSRSRRTGRPRVRRSALFTVLGAVVVSTTLLAGVMIASPDRSAAGQRTTASPPARPTRTLPRGYHWYSGTQASALTAQGFSVAVPDGWRAFQRGSLIALHDPATGGSITITRMAPGSGGPLQRVRALQRATLRRGKLHGYHRITVGLFAFRGRLGGVWRFRYHNRGGGTVDALDVVARLGSGEYELSVASPAADWQATSKVFGKVLQTFTPHPS